MFNLDREEILGKKSEGKWLLCLHCERAYKDTEFRLIKNGKEFLYMCPYEGCDGDTIMDAIDWEDVKQGHSDYPDEPIKGVYYALN